MNPLMQSMGMASGGAKINMQALQSVKQAMKVFQTIQNPEQALEQMAQNNPALNSVMQMVKGRDPKDVFYEECKKMGVNPDEVINMLK